MRLIILESQSHTIENNIVMNQPTLIIIAGPSASGKTCLVKQLVQHIPDIVAVVNCDNYYLSYDHLSPEEKFGINFDHPDSIEWGLIAKHLNTLKQGQAIEMPQYCFKEQTRLNHCRTVEPKPLILIDGLLSLAKPEIRNIVNFSVYLDTPLDICLSRKMIRDMNERGRKPDFIMKQYQHHTRPMYLQFIEPSRQFADIVIPSSLSVDKILSFVQHKFTTNIAT